MYLGWDLRERERERENDLDRNRRPLRLTQPYLQCLLQPLPWWHTCRHDHLRTLPRHRDICRRFLQRLLLHRRTSIWRWSQVKRLSPLFALLGKVNYMGATRKGQFAKLADQIMIATRIFIIINYVLFFFFFYFFLIVFYLWVIFCLVGEKMLEKRKRICIFEFKCSLKFLKYLDSVWLSRKSLDG